MHPTQTDDREQPTGDRWSPTVQAANRRPQRLQDRFDRVACRRRAVLGPESVADPIYLEPGQHELCLQVSDGAHTALDITDTVTVDVEVENLQQCSVVGEMDVDAFPNRSQTALGGGPCTKASLRKSESFDTITWSCSPGPCPNLDVR